MKIKSLLIFVFTLMSLTAFAQSGGIKGKVVSREGRVAVDGVKVSVTPGEMTATTDGRGGFVIENVEPGEYTLQFEAPEFEPLTLVVRVDKMVRDINTVILVPEVLSTVMDDSIFAEFDTESGNDAQSLPSSLSASKDVFNNIASYRFSEMRFNVRGNYTITGLGEDDIIIERLAAGKTVVIDAKTGLATIDGANAFDKVNMWTFPVLKTGETALTFSNTKARVTIRYTPARRSLFLFSPPPLPRHKWRTLGGFLCLPAKTPATEVPVIQ